MLLGYARVSTKEQAEDDRTSLPEQERIIRGLAMARGVGPYDIALYSDPGVSGSIPLKDRPAGAKLLNDAQTNDIVVAAKLDRMFRDALDAQEIYRLFKDRQVDLILYDMGHEPVTRDGMSKCFFTIISAFADLERSRIAERMMEGKRAKIAKGGHAGGEAPYGYQIIGSGREARPEPAQAEQDILQVVKIRAGYGDTPWQIARHLNEHGRRTRMGKPFLDTQVKRMVQREMRA